MPERDSRRSSRSGRLSLPADDRPPVEDGFLTRPLVIAHRGASGEELENTLAAFRLARDQRADGIELDLHLTSDGELVVHHDPVVDGHLISEGSAAELAGHRLSNGEAVPTLGQVLDGTGPGVELFLEVKALPEWGDARLLDLIDGAPDPTRCQVHSFDHRIIHRLKRTRADLKTGVLSASYPLDPVAGAVAAGAETLWQVEDLVDSELVAAAHGAGLAVIAWTTDDPDRIEALAAMGVDGICTNLPARAREVLGDD